MSRCYNRDQNDAAVALEECNNKRYFRLVSIKPQLRLHDTRVKIRKWV